MLDEGARRGLENRTQESGGEADALALNVGARFAPEPQRVLVAAEVHADFLKDHIRRRFNAREPFLAEELISRDLALDAGNDGMGPLGLALPPRPASPFSLRRRGCVAHAGLRLFSAGDPCDAGKERRDRRNGPRVRCRHGLSLALPP